MYAVLCLVLCFCMKAGQWHVMQDLWPAVKGTTPATDQRLLGCVVGLEHWRCCFEGAEALRW